MTKHKYRIKYQSGFHQIQEYSFKIRMWVIIKEFLSLTEAKVYRRKLHKLNNSQARTIDAVEERKESNLAYNNCIETKIEKRKMYTKKQLGESRTQKGGNNMMPVNPKPKLARPVPRVRGEKMPDFQKELEELINSHSKENESNTPDFILATYLSGCLEAFNNAIKSRDKWYSVNLCPGESEFTRGNENERI